LPIDPRRHWHIVEKHSRCFGAGVLPFEASSRCDFDQSNSTSDKSTFWQSDGAQAEKLIEPCLDAADSSKDDASIYIRFFPDFLMLV
jgi:hypothetical protein